jgi:hypothetical protein
LRDCFLPNTVQGCILIAFYVSLFIHQFLERTTTIENPCYEYDPIAEHEVESASGTGIAVMGVDILPTELPRESSSHFGGALVGVVRELLYAKEHQEAKTNGIDTSLLSNGLVRCNAV